HAEEMLRYGRVVSRPRRAWLGVFAHALEDGVIIAGLVPGSPADKGGLREGDMIMSVNAEEISSRRDLYMRLWRHEPGARLALDARGAGAAAPPPARPPRPAAVGRRFDLFRSLPDRACVILRRSARHGGGARWILG